MIPSKEEEEEKIKTMLTLRIKPNTPLPSSTDPTITIPTNATVYTLKQTISAQLHFQKRYIRLIHSGRLLAPDDAILTSFGMKNDAVIHCVVAKEGVSGGIQAKLATSSDGRSGIGVDGRIIPAQRRWNSSSLRRNDHALPHDSDLDSDLDLDLEEGRRRGFDRLRDEGFSRSEVNAIRTYFSNQVHVYRMRQDAEEGQGLVEEEEDVNHETSTTTSTTTTNTTNTPNMNNMTNEETEYDPETALRNRTLQAEEEWMALQGPHSEFRLNLNADHYLPRRRLWIALGGGGAGAGRGGGIERTRRRRGRRGRIGQRGTTMEGDGIMSLSMGGEEDDEEEEEEGLENNDPRSSMTMNGLHMYNSPLGTDRDFIWGFVLAYLCGFVMMFWVMNPTVAHRQKLGILTGLCFHILLHMFESTHHDYESEEGVLMEGMEVVDENLLLNPLD